MIRTNTTLVLSQKAEKGMISFIKMANENLLNSGCVKIETHPWYHLQYHSCQQHLLSCNGCHSDLNHLYSWNWFVNDAMYTFQFLKLVVVSIYVFPFNKKTYPRVLFEIIPPCWSFPKLEAWLKPTPKLKPILYKLTNNFLSFYSQSVTSPHPRLRG